MKKLGLQLAKTLALSAIGTTALVAGHHLSRRQHQADATILDYPRGARLELARLIEASKVGANAFYQAYAAQPQTVLFKSSDSNESFDAGQKPPIISWVSGVAALVEGGYGVVGLSHQRQVLWQTPMPERVHDIVVQPFAFEPHGLQGRQVVVMGRRPSENFWVLECANGHIQHLVKAQTNRHFYGHACYSLDGKLLYVTENDTVTLAGKIGIYEVAQGYQKVAEFDTHGVGPHELVMHPDNETLIIANGGIKTEKASREELNLDTMRPSLVYLDRHDGRLLEQVLPQHNQMSIRHLDIHDNGTVMIGIQFQGAPHINVPLVLTHQRGDSELKPLMMQDNQWYCFHQYIASVALDSANQLLCVTSPIGGCAVVFDLRTRKAIKTVQLPDCAGASVLKVGSDNNCKTSSGFIVSDGQGVLTTLTLDNQVNPNNPWQIKVESVHHKMSFDNHLQAL